MVQYDGTAYLGWQYQTQGPTVQSTLEDAIAKVLGPHRILVAGRTDSGVHAIAQVAALRTGKAFPAVELHRALNGILPPDISVLSVEVVPNEFDPRRDAVGKLYRYRFFDRFVRPVFERNQVWHVWNVDWTRMAIALPQLVGTHDFVSFQGSGANPKPGARSKNGRLKTPMKTVRTISRLALVRPPAEHEVWLEVEGNGFLKQMVRNIAGSLMQVGRGFREPEWIASILAAKDRSVAGPTAPASGLTLVRVEYPPPPATS